MVATKEFEHQELCSQREWRWLEVKRLLHRPEQKDQIEKESFMDTSWVKKCRKTERREK
jgi:hypothetical protein